MTAYAAALKAFTIVALELEETIGNGFENNITVLNKEQTDEHGFSGDAYVAVEDSAYASASYGGSLWDSLRERVEDSLSGDGYFCEWHNSCELNIYEE